MENLTDKAFTYGTAVVGGFAGAYVSIRKIIALVKKGKEKPKDRCSECGLCRHKLFQILESFLRNIESPKWKCINQYKTENAKDAIRIKFTISTKRIKDWVCKNKDVQNSADLCDDFQNMIREMMEEYESQWVLAGINPIIINKLAEYHNSNARFAISLGVAELKRTYNDTNESLHHLLDGLIIPYSMFISDVRAVMDSFNGVLANDVYKGFVNNGEFIPLQISQFRFSFEG